MNQTKLADKTTTIADLKEIVNKFVQERDWSQFHDAKNLSMVISTEAAELMELLRWVSSQDVDATVEKHREALSLELIDILWACLCFANKYNIDLSSMLQKKCAINAQRYPAEHARGKSDKYTAYHNKQSND
jgi:dCTP diphosphatase